jgi:Secretion system C-terminal sorting domain
LSYISVFCNLAFCWQVFWAKNTVKIVRDKVELCLVTIADLNGKPMLSKQLNEHKEQVDLSKLSIGVYLIKLQTKQEIKVLKLVVE